MKNIDIKISWGFIIYIGLMLFIMFIVITQVPVVEGKYFKNFVQRIIFLSALVTVVTAVFYKDSDKSKISCVVILCIAMTGIIGIYECNAQKDSNIEENIMNIEPQNQEVIQKDKIIPIEKNKIIISARPDVNINKSEYKFQQELQVKIIENINKEMNTNNLSDNEELNSNKEYTDLIEKAKDVNDSDLLEINKLDKMLKLWIKARKIGENRALNILIARDYFNLANAYAEKNCTQEAFTNYESSIEEYMRVIRCTLSNEKYMCDEKDIAYIIGNIYHSKGNLDLSKDVKLESYQNALAYLNIGGDNIDIVEKENLYKNYFLYRGTLNQKIAILAKKDKVKFLQDAEGDYIKFLKFSNRKTDRSKVYKSLADVYYLLIEEYIKNGNKEKELLYREKKDSVKQSRECLLSNL
ncbi:hypothetical protein [Anaeromicrobium sediminis]|uniref:Uncharacterized protein n=1 Tax=Anaeromicrobium sediminis TaxID=1478221 RepID=A0A267MNY4_9FIRM|nr:hypothetical protein [Anaeromicrobium sediminis]PAB60533.1 hypothetical protein CCE28_03040 [Anaeromicrobium sediminis]